VTTAPCPTCSKHSQATRGRPLWDHHCKSLGTNTLQYLFLPDQPAMADPLLEPVHASTSSNDKSRHPGQRFRGGAL